MPWRRPVDLWAADNRAVRPVSTRPVPTRRPAGRAGTVLAWSSEDHGPGTAARCHTAPPHFQVRRDEVTGPDGRRGGYDWVQAPDQVRVAALVEGQLLLVEQYHYLAGALWQLPGGSVDPDDDALTAARRELAEETGYHGGT